jgi:hypothetical protein
VCSDHSQIEMCAQARYAPNKAAGIIKKKLAMCVGVSAGIATRRGCFTKTESAGAFRNAAHISDLPIRTHVTLRAAMR